MAYETIKTETRGHVGLITLHRPDALNALSAQLLGELAQALRAYDADAHIGAIVLTGSEKAFAAGADIREMSEHSYPQTYLDDFMGGDACMIERVRKPVIAAVAGYALGGGCELAMACDFIIAGESAKFGQPEINLGVIPGIGGTQRLARAVGKAKAMDMVLTGRFMDAAEAERSGLIARIVADDELVDQAVAAAAKIAEKSRPSVYLSKECVNRAFETTLAEGLRFERSVFYALFATEDQKEGMQAFVEKRKAQFRDK